MNEKGKSPICPSIRSGTQRPKGQRSHPAKAWTRSTKQWASAMQIPGRKREIAVNIQAAGSGSIVCPRTIGSKVCPQKHHFTLGAEELKTCDFGLLEAKCVQKYRMDANDVQKYYHLRDRRATIPLCHAGSHRSYFSRSSACELPGLLSPSCP